MWPIVVALAAIVGAAHAECQRVDPLPSWNDGLVKQQIVAFVTRVTTPGPDCVDTADRVATFDNDGTLWPERPTAIVVYIHERLLAMAAKDPSLKTRQPYKAALANDLAYLAHAGPAAVATLYGAALGNETEEHYADDVAAFYRTATQPKFGVPYAQTAYRPMLELLQYLRAQGFQTWICSGGDVAFMRAVSQTMYGVRPELVIGSSLADTARLENGRLVLWRKPALSSFNDKGAKPVNIALHIGRRPLFAAGNVGGGGDIAMLEYSQGRPGPSFQLLVNHDDAVREFAYQERDSASLTAARAHRWTVVSMKSDWNRIIEPSPAPR
jgi:hypothetical protein